MVYIGWLAGSDLEILSTAGGFKFFKDDESPLPPFLLSVKGESK